MPDDKLNTRLRSFDFLRGLAILGVIGVHCVKAFPSGIGLVDTILGAGAKGVQLFFFVSSLTMFYMWKKREGESSPVLKFYVRRFLRIAPLFWLAIPVYILAEGRAPNHWAPEGIGIDEILLTATFLHGFWPGSINSVVPGGWSIAVEMTFYALFPVLVILFKDDARKYLATAIAIWLFNVLLFKDAATAFFAVHQPSASPGLISDYLYLNFVNQAPVFLMGAYLFFSLTRGIRKGDVPYILAWVAAGLLVQFKLHIGGLNFLAVCLAIGIFAFACIKWDIKYTPVELLGRNSYAIYLVHILILHGLQKVLPVSSGPLALALGMGLTILASYLVSRITYALIERRVQVFADAVTHSRRPREFKLAPQAGAATEK